MVLNVVFPSGRHAKLGTMIPLTKDTVRAYIKKYPRSWISF